MACLIWYTYVVYKEIIQRAIDTRSKYDHIAWRCVCPSCGLKRNIFGEVIKKVFKDEHKDMKKIDIKCNSPKCRAVVKTLGRMSNEQALHKTDITRRGLTEEQVHEQFIRRVYELKTDVGL